MPATSPESQPSSIALAISNLHVGHRQAPVIVGLSWSLAKGEIAALLGPAGSGKSTLLAALAGLSRPAQGTATLLGASAGSTAAKRVVGYVPQADGLLDDMSAEENLRFFASLVDPALATPERLEATLALLELRKRRHEPIRTLSALHRARVSLGAALVTEPEVLLLDEPLALADSAFADRAWEHLRTLASRGVAIVVATGQAAVAARAPRVGVLRAGRLAAEVSPSTLVPAGKARIVLRFKDRERSASREEVIEAHDYRVELVNLLTAPQRPYEVEVQTASVESELARYLTEELSHVGSRP